MIPFVQISELSLFEDYDSTDYNPLLLFYYGILMFDFYLPYCEQFIQVLKKKEIHEWQAKKFWSNFDNQSNSDPIFSRQKMYAGLKILHRNGFLAVKYPPKIRGYFYTLRHKNSKKLEIKY